MNVIVILGVLAVVYSIMGMLLVKFGLRGLQCTRAFSRVAVFEGDEGEMTIDGFGCLLIFYYRKD